MVVEAGNLVADRTYLFALVVISSDGRASTSVEHSVYTKVTGTPVVQFLKSDIGFNPTVINNNQRLLLSANIKSEDETRVYYTWDDSTALVKRTETTTLDTTWQSGYAATAQLFELALLKNVLVEGKTYTFTITAEKTLDSSLTASASFTVRINSAPSCQNVDSCLIVSPDEGYSFDRKNPFTFTAMDFADEELPLTFTFYTQSKPPLDIDASLAPIGSASTKRTVSTHQIAPGLIQDGYEVKALCVVSDSLSASSRESTRFTARRQTPDSSKGETVESLIQDNYDTGIQEALEENDVDKIIALNSATTGTVNAPISCVPVNSNGFDTTCEVLNRASCNSPLDNVCGKCLDGYSVLIVPDPLDNSDCIEDTVVSNRRRLSLSNGQDCNTDDECHYGNCEDSKCVMPLKQCQSSTSTPCSGNGTCIYLDHKAEPVQFCRVGDADCFPYCRCMSPFSGVACELSNSSYFARDQLRYSLCDGLIKTDDLTTATQTYIGEFLQSLADGLKPFEMRAEARAKCKEAVKLAFGYIEDDDLFNGNNANIDRENAVAILSMMTESYLNTKLYNLSTDASVMDIDVEDTLYLVELAQILQNRIQSTMSQGAKVVEVTSPHLRIAAHYALASSLEGATIFPAMTEEIVEYNLTDMTVINFPLDGVSSCFGSQEYASFGVMEWGIMPVGRSNSSFINNIEDSLVQLTFAMPSPVPRSDISSRYNVSVSLQEPIDFNVSYPFEGFNRTFPVLYTASMDDDGTQFLMQNCNATNWTNESITFDCPDFGMLCSESEENSGYVQVIDGADYMVNSIAGGKYFLEGKYTSSPTSVPSGEPTSQPSSVPTGEPTSTPTLIPSGAPTVQPSSIPTGEPTRMPVYPTGQPTSAPSSQPSTQPTGQPTSQPSSSPTFFPTYLDPTEANVVFQQKFKTSLNANAFNGDPHYALAFRMAVSNMTHVRLSRVSITSVRTWIEAFRLRGRRRLAPGDEIGLDVEYQVNLVLEEMVGVNDQRTFDQVQTTLTDTIYAASNASSTFKDKLIAAATFVSGSSSDVTFTFQSFQTQVPNIVVEAINEPTSEPSGAPTSLYIAPPVPTPFPWFYIVAVIAGLLCVWIVYICYYAYQRRLRIKREKPTREIDSDEEHDSRLGSSQVLGEFNGIEGGSNSGLSNNHHHGVSGVKPSMITLISGSVGRESSGSSGRPRERNGMRIDARNSRKRFMDRRNRNDGSGNDRRGHRSRRSRPLRHDNDSDANGQANSQDVHEISHAPWSNLLGGAP